MIKFGEGCPEAVVAGIIQKLLRLRVRFNKDSNNHHHTFGYTGEENTLFIIDDANYLGWATDYISGIHEFYYQNYGNYIVVSVLELIEILRLKNLHKVTFYQVLSGYSGREVKFDKNSNVYRYTTLL